MIWLFYALFDWAIIILSAIYLPFIFAALVVGNRVHALSVLAHDAAHNLTGLGKWNDLIAKVLFFWPLCLDMSGYRKHHLQHHRYLGTNDDPELDSRDKVYEDGISIWRSIKDLFGLGIPRLLEVFKLFLPRDNLKLTPGIIVQLLILTFLPWHYIILWYFSLVTVFWMIFRRRIWLEHIPNLHQQVTISWWYALLFAPHNTWYHYEHHRRPYIFHSINYPKQENGDKNL